MAGHRLYFYRAFYGSIRFSEGFMEFSILFAAIFHLVFSFCWQFGAYLVKTSVCTSFNLLTQFFVKNQYGLQEGKLEKLKGKYGQRFHTILLVLLAYIFVNVNMCMRLKVTK